MTIRKYDFSFGLTKNAEKLNGRIAMSGFLIIVLFEISIKKSLFVFLFLQ